jgi:hypothetical protein
MIITEDYFRKITAEFMCCLMSRSSALETGCNRRNNNNNYNYNYNNNNYYYYYIMSFMQGIRTYVPETNHVSRVHSVAATPRLLVLMHTTLSSILNSFVLLH